MNSAYPWIEDKREGLGMPVLTRWFLKSSMLFLVISLLVGVLLASRAPFNLAASIAAFNPVFIHLFMVGWVTQLIFGVAYWMFPKYSKEKPRGSDTLGWLVFWLLNAGLVTRLVGEPAQAISPQPVWAWILALSGLLQWAAGIIFVINTWGRVKER
jgi:cbb3-type cytochrome oxidase subunit 1